MAQILLIENEANIRDFLKMNFQKNGFDIIEAKSGEDAIKISLLKKPDIVILDTILTGIDGFKVCQILRNKIPNIGIIILSARANDSNKIMGLEHGADDYITKPFNIIEVILRVKALLRRIKGNSKNEDLKIVHKNFTLDLYSEAFFKDENKISLTPKEFLLMKIFLNNIGKAFSRNELLNLVWGIDFIGDPKIVDVNIRRLRVKIEDNSSQPQYIETIWGLGYRWKE